VFTARYALSPYVKQIGFVFKGLIWLLRIMTVETNAFGFHFETAFPSLMLRLVACFTQLSLISMGRGGVVSIATRYGLDCPGIESQCGRDFPHPPSLVYNRHPVYFPEMKRPWPGVDHLKNYIYTPTPRLGIHVSLWGELYLNQISPSCFHRAFLLNYSLKSTNNNAQIF
jgi:hypothetical protein